MDVKPHEDYGFFGPDSVTWKVWTYPTSVTIGFQRAVVIEELDPALIAAVDATSDVRYRPRTRYDRTLRYFAMISLGDTRAAMTASNVLVKVHAKAVGIEPLSGNRYDANDPHSQLWIHLTAWHSILYAYEKYGPGKLTPEEEERYWAECAVAAELQTCDPADVPRSREGIREYFAYMRPRLAGSEAAQSMMDHLLNAKVMMPPVPLPLRAFNSVVNEVHRRATIATMPHWMRKMAGLRQSRVTDALVTPVMKIAFAVGAANPRLMLAVLNLLSPGTVPVAAPVLLGIPPERPETLTPAQARERYGILPPTEEYARFREHIDSLAATNRAQEVGPGIDESVAILGAVA
ncbi:MAG: oxygenase MpaB family protein [Solirubrobacteraceae bacterium]